MKALQKKLTAFLLSIVLCFLNINHITIKAYAGSADQYLVLVQQKDGSWKGYDNFIEISKRSNLMVKAKPLAKALGFTYKRNDDGTFLIKSSSDRYNTYTKNSREYIYTDQSEEVKRSASDIAYTSKASMYNLCQVSTICTLADYKVFISPNTKKYSGYKGIICYSRYQKIPVSVPEYDFKSEPKPTQVPAMKPNLMMIEGVEFPVRERFLSVGEALSDWGGTYTLWGELERAVDSKIIASTNLVIESDRIGFSHLTQGSDGVYLAKASKGYKLSISVKLDGSVIADQNASIVKAILTTISSEPSLVYSAIFESFTTDDSHGINEDTYTSIGDCKIKVEVKEGIVTYLIKEST